MTQAGVVWREPELHYPEGRRARRPAFLKLQMCEEGSASCLDKEHPRIGARPVGQAE